MNFNALLISVAILVSAVATAFEIRNVFNFEMKQESGDRFEILRDFITFKNFLKTKLFSSTTESDRGSGSGGKLVTLGEFKYTNCGQEAEEIVNIKSLSISEDPIYMPGPLTLNAQYDVKTDITGQVPVLFYLLYREDSSQSWQNKTCDMSFIPVPCQLEDLCLLLNAIPCPAQWQQCHCPFKKGSVTINNAQFLLTAAALRDGEYNATIVAKTQTSKPVGCYNVIFTIKTE